MWLISNTLYGYTTDSFTKVFWKTDLPEEMLHYVYAKFRLWKITGPVKC